MPLSVLSAAAPWRLFRWHQGQQHYSGTFWSSTQRDHVIYESRLELAVLLLADFHPLVLGIVAQPFLLRDEVGGETRRHVPPQHRLGNRLVMHALTTSSQFNDSSSLVRC